MQTQPPIGVRPSRHTNQERAATALRASSRRVRRVIIAMLLSLFALAACGGSETSADRFTLDDIVATMSGEGFSGEEGTMADGTPR